MDIKPEPKVEDTEDSIVTNIVTRLKHYDIRLHHPYPETKAMFRRASVLLPLTVRNGEIFLLLTRRSKELRTHPSTVALPGGLREDSDTSDVDTALREAEEEIGLPLSSVKILAVLTRGITLPNNIVYPVVGFIPNDFQPKMNPHEVEATFYIPLREFLSDKVTMANFKIHGQVYQAPSLNYDDGKETFLIYGFTMYQCIMLARIIFDENADVMKEELELYFNRAVQNFLSTPASRL